MANRKFKGLLIVAAGAAALLAVNAFAQTAQRRPASLEFNQMFTRSNTLQQLGLADQTVGLSSEQRTEIDKIVDTYLAEQKVLREKYPVTPGTPMSPEATKAFRASQTNLGAGLARVLTSKQMDLIQASQQAKEAQRTPPGVRRPEH